MPTERALVSVVGTHTLLNGIERMGGIGLGDTVVVQGSGPMGIGGLIMAKLLGAGRCIVIGAPPNRLELAREMGADDTVDIGVYNEPDARVAKNTGDDRRQGRRRGYRVLRRPGSDGGGP